MRYPVELIKWLDSQAVYNWNSRDEYEKTYKDDLTITSVGFVVYESEDRVMLLMNNGVEQWDMMMCIPKVCIVNREQLTLFNREGQ